MSNMSYNIPARRFGEGKMAKSVVKPSKEELGFLYDNQRLNVTQIAKKIGVAEDTVKKWIIGYGFNYRGIGPRKNPKDFVKPSKEELSNLYHDQKLTLRDLGKKFNVSKTTVKEWFNKYGLKARSDPQEAKLGRRNIYLPNKEQLSKDYEFLSVDLIARKYGISTEPILTLLTNTNIQKRNRSESRKLAEKTGRFFSWNKGKGINDPKIAEMMQNLHKKQMEKKDQTKIKQSETRKRLFAEGKLKSWTKWKTGVYSEETINKIRKARLGQKITKNTKPEQLMRLLLEKNDLTNGLVEQYGLKIGKFLTIPDFAYPEHKLAIYCDGEFWHGGFHHINQSFEKMKEGRVKESIKKTREKDAKIHFTLWNNGWTPLRFWQRAIEKTPEWVIEQIKKNLFDKEYIKKREAERKEYLTMPVI